MTRRVVTVFGGSGFIGRHVVGQLAALGLTVRAAMRDPVAGALLRPMGEVGQVNPIRADITNATQVRAAVAGADAVVNLVGILTERGKRDFHAIHVQGAANVAQAARDSGVAQMVHLSALGADIASPAAYARSKAEGEQAVRAAFPAAAILRPSVVFGPDDDFFNRFAALARLSPVLPVFTRDGFRLGCTDTGCALDLFGSGGPAFQPVHVGDVAQAVAACLTRPELAGRTFELGGPRRYTMKEIMELVLGASGLKRRLLPLPFAVAGLQAALLKLLPNPPLTPDQVALMRTDNVVNGTLPGLADLGITPTSCEAVVPTYLKRYGGT